MKQCIYLFLFPVVQKNDRKASGDTSDRSVIGAAATVSSSATLPQNLNRQSAVPESAIRKGSSKHPYQPALASSLAASTSLTTSSLSSAATPFLPGAGPYQRGVKSAALSTPIIAAVAIGQTSTEEAERVRVLQKQRDQQQSEKNQQRQQRRKEVAFTY